MPVCLSLRAGRGSKYIQWRYLDGTLRKRSRTAWLYGQGLLCLAPVLKLAVVVFAKCLVGLAFLCPSRSGFAAGLWCFGLMCGGMGACAEWPS